jgi:hypothetical protein
VYAPGPEDVRRNANNFRYHKPHSESQEQRYGTIRARLLGTADLLLTLCPPGRELSLALTKLEEAMFWGIAAIARNEKD